MPGREENAQQRERAHDARHFRARLHAHRQALCRRAGLRRNGSSLPAVRVELNPDALNQDDVVTSQVGTLLIPFGGAFKDAPIEGFHTFKFFRSPALAAFYSWLLSFLTDSYMIGAVGGLVGSLGALGGFFLPPLFAYAAALERALGEEAHT